MFRSVAARSLSRQLWPHLRLALNQRRPAPLSPAPRRSYTSWSTSVNNLADWTPHETLREWVLDRIRLLRPARVHLCDGSQQEHDELLTQMVHSGMLVRLNEALRPNSYVARSTASDVARVEERTFICSENKSDAGFTSNWADPEEMLSKLTKLFDGCMKGRTMSAYAPPIPPATITSQRCLPQLRLTAC